MHMARPYLHQFLTVAYQRGFDIVIWSATSLSWAKLKMRDMGVLSHSSYKIAGFLHRDAMITISHPERGRVDVKPLGVLWGQFPESSRPETTVFIDDLRRNALMNPQNGIKIVACRNMASIRATDRELLHLAAYLALISARRNDFSSLKHKHWKRYLKEHGLDVDTASVEEVGAFIDNQAPPKAVCWATATTTVTTSSSSSSGAGGAGGGAGAMDDESS
jgi:ubiquitin-like domain-containing CTD phosphatase 1